MESPHCTDILHRLKVKKGDFVTEGEIIGKMVPRVEQ